MSRGGGAIHSQILPGKPHHNRILCLLAPLSSVLQHHKTAIVNRRFNHNHRPPVRQTIANFSLEAKKRIIIREEILVRNWMLGKKFGVP